MTLVTFQQKNVLGNEYKMILFKFCENGDKYQITQGGGSYTIVISDPTPEDTGCYK